MRRIKLIIVVPIAIIVIALSVSNRQDVVINLWPLPWTIDVPLYMLGFLLFAAGALTGGLAVWSSRMRRNRRLRKAHEQHKPAPPVDSETPPSSAPPMLRSS